MKKPACASKRDVLEHATLRYVLEKKNARLIFFPTINFFTLKGCMIAWKRSCPDRQPFSDTFRDSYVVPSQYIKFIYSENF